MSEEWRPVVGYEGNYEVSDQGRVRSLDRVIVTKTSVSQKREGKVLSAHTNRLGYRMVVLSPGGTRYVHRLVLEAFVGLPPEGKPFSLHWNGNPSDNQVSNLRWGSQADNMADKQRHGKHWPSNRTHCPKGHPYDQENTRIYKGYRSCKACVRLKREEGLPPGDTRHGTRNGYTNYYCRCEPCRAVDREYKRKRGKMR